MIRPDCRPASRSWALLAVVLWAGCSRSIHATIHDDASAGDGGAPSGDLAQASDLATGCVSGEQWNPNDEPGPGMFPGRACIQCHHDENAASGDGDAPIFSFAGTVYSNRSEPDDCVASASKGAQVEVTDATGTIHLAEVTASGNFSFTADGLVYPLRARVLFAGRERRMVGAQSSGDCNGCHGAVGSGGASGRITLP